MKIFNMITSLGIAGDAMWIRINKISQVFKRNRHEVLLCHYVLKIGRNKHKSVLVNSKVYEHKYGVDLTRTCNIVSIIPKFLKDIKSDKYDIIYGNTFMGAIIPILTKKYHKLPIILDVHGILTEEYKLKSTNQTHLINSLFNHFLEYICFKYANGFFCVSKKMIDYLHTVKEIPNNKLFYIPNGVDLEFFNLASYRDTLNLRREIGIENKFVFGYLGGSQEWQGLDNYIAAIKKIERKDAVFLFVGTGKQGTENNAIFIPSVSRDQIPLYYSLCDVFVLPRPEYIATIVAAPTKFAEYCAMGKPVLVTKVGDAADLVNRYNNGLVVKSNESKYIYEGIMDLLNMNSDTLISMGANSRALAKKEFDWKGIGISIEKAMISINN